MHKGLRVLWLLAGSWLIPGFALASNAEHKNEHYTAVGFFDIHVCNWPDRAPFYMALFSTPQFNEVASIELANARGEKLAALDLSRFRIINAEGKPEKRVFINQIPLPADYADGVFSASITLKDGAVYSARDFVEHGIMPLASDVWPAHRSEVTVPPEVLHWSAVAGAAYYQVFIRDKWEQDKLIFTSEILNQPEVAVPEELLEHGGYYAWRVHARDVNEDIKLGDFNQGSLSEWREFTVAD